MLAALVLIPSNTCAAHFCSCFADCLGHSLRSQSWSACNCAHLSNAPKHVQELDDGQAAILRVMEQLDSRKDEILARTFRDVSAAFENVFSELVPGGHGVLKMIHNTMEDSPDPYIGVIF